MWQAIKMFKESNRQTKFLIFMFVLYMTTLVWTTLQSYARLEYSRSDFSKPIIIQANPPDQSS